MRTQVTQHDATKVIRTLRANGWGQYHGRDADGRYCVRGAIAAALPVSHWNMAFVSLRAHLDRYLVSWNDDPHRTFDEVIVALMKWRNTLPVA